METQVKVNGQVIILADTNPLHKKGYCQWKNINTGQIWNVDGSKAEVCFNAELAQEHSIKHIGYPVPTEMWNSVVNVSSKITFLAPIITRPNTIEICRNNKTIEHTWVETIDTTLDQNQIMIHNLYDGNIFVDIWEKGVGYVPSCGTGAAAAALFSDKTFVEIYCRGGKYVIEKDYYRWTMQAKNIS